MMIMRYLVLVCGVLAPILSRAEALNVENLRYCCGLGTNYAFSNLGCDTYQGPIPGIEKKDEFICVKSIKSCCNRQKEVDQCSEGVNDAQNVGTCTPEPGSKKECCEACQIGIDASKSGQNCEDELGLGPTFDKAFKDCCKDSLKTSTTSTSTTEQTVSENKYIGPTKFSPLPPLENVCDIGDVCAQICIPTGDSYRCDCNKGFSLMTDGVSCKPDKRSLKKDKCAVNNPCDQICTDTGVAIKCSCNEGYELASDKKTCKDIDECALNLHDCQSPEDCVNVEGDYSCGDSDDASFGTDPSFDSQCPAGYKFNYDKLVCDDIDECEFDIICPRPKTCINTIGSFKCEGEERLQCPSGFEYKPESDICDDIDECLSGKDDCNKESQSCLNTRGNYTCTDKVSTKTCPPGFKKNQTTNNCEDINECEENDELCAANEECVNESGGHTCIPKTGIPSNKPIHPYPLPPPSPPTLEPLPTEATTPKSCPKGSRLSRNNNCEDIDECLEDHQSCDSTQDCRNTQGSFSCSCKIGYTLDKTGACADINECQINAHHCSLGQRCDNTVGSYLCARITGCGTGYTLNQGNSLCEDDDECTLGTDRCNELGPNYKCQNSLGSYRCELMKPSQKPRSRYPTSPKYNPYSSYQNPRPESTTSISRSQQDPYRNPRPETTTALPNRNPYGRYPNPDPRPERITPVLNVNPYLLHPIPDQQNPRPESTPSVPNPPPIVPFAYPNPIESTTSVPNPRPIVPFAYPNPIETTPRAKVSHYPIYTNQNVRPYYVPYNPYLPAPNLQETSTRSSTTQLSLISGVHKRCLPGYFMNASGACEDINECENNPCSRGHRCENSNGRYDCISTVQCRLGYEFNEIGETCVDINECARGTHKCTQTQICKNGEGFYTCECPPGHHLDPTVQQCVDIDECKYYRVCGNYATCINTIGSYKCQCQSGFRSENKICQDINECKDTSGLCQQTCVNTWGSYKCACNSGFTLNYDNRTCTDVDECEKFKDNRLCVGICENTPGSYKCTCPEGYRLGSDERTCSDVDECLQNICPRADDVCVNVRGSYKCYSITCPNNYIRDPQHKGRCKRLPTFCDRRDTSCVQIPDQYTYHYLSFVSNLPIPNNRVQLFQINGPRWLHSRAEFSLKVLNVNAGYNVERASERFFQLEKPGHNIMHLYLRRSIAGPQEIQLEIQMQIFQNNALVDNVVSYLYIIVSQYTF